MRATYVGVDVLLSQNAPRAVLIIRKRTRLFHIVLWNLAKNTLDHGSWFRGRIDNLKCDLSPDGKLMVYFALGPTKDLFSWTAICTPPFLRAHILWAHDNTWFGGGFFKSNYTLETNFTASDVIVEKRETPLIKRLSKKFRVIHTPSFHPAFSHIFEQRLVRSGWRSTGTYGWPQRLAPHTFSFENTDVRLDFSPLSN